MHVSQVELTLYFELLSQQAQMLQNHTQHMLENSHQPMEYVHAHAVSNPLNHRQMGQQVINLSREILSRNHPRYCNIIQGSFSSENEKLQLGGEAGI